MSPKFYPQISYRLLHRPMRAFRISQAARQHCCNDGQYLKVNGKMEILTPPPCRSETLKNIETKIKLE